MSSPIEYEFCRASLCPTATPRARGTLLIDENRSVWVPNSTGTGHVSVGATADAVQPLLSGAWNRNSTPPQLGALQYKTLKQRISTQRFFIGSIGNSINSQDAPVNTGNLKGLVNAVSPMFWLNALCLGAFDFVGPSYSTITATAGTQTQPAAYSNGAMGYSGGLISQFQNYALDQYLAQMVIDCAGRPFAVLLGDEMNSLNNNDVAGYAETIWPIYLAQIQKIQAAGGFPLLTCGRPSGVIDTMIKRRNKAKWRDLVMSYAAGRGDCAAMDARLVREKYLPGVPLNLATRLDSGTGTGDQVHPNITSVICEALGWADALQGLFEFAPPWERADFTGTFVGTNYPMTGTAGFKGANVTVGSVVPTGWTANAFGAGHSSVVTPGIHGVGPGVFTDTTAPTTPTVDRIGFDGAAPTVDTTTVYRAYVDMDVIKADYANTIEVRVRMEGTNYFQVPQWGGTDSQAMTPDVPNGPKLLEGRRVVLSSMPFNFPAASSGALYCVGGGSGLSSTLGRLKTFTRFAGLIR